MFAARLAARAVIAEAHAAGFSVEAVAARAFGRFDLDPESNDYRAARLTKVSIRAAVPADVCARLAAVVQPAFADFEDIAPSPDVEVTPVDAEDVPAPGSGAAYTLETAFADVFGETMCATNQFKAAVLHRLALRDRAADARYTQTALAVAYPPGAVPEVTASSQWVDVSPVPGADLPVLSMDATLARSVAFGSLLTPVKPLAGAWAWQDERRHRAVADSAVFRLHQAPTSWLRALDAPLAPLRLGAASCCASSAVVPPSTTAGPGECGCTKPQFPTATEQSAKTLSDRAYVVAVFFAFVLWVALYNVIESFADWLAYTALGLDEAEGWGPALAFWFYDTPKVLLLLILVSSAVSFFRSYLTRERIQALLALGDARTTSPLRRGAKRFALHLLASILGAISPFCSCSAVPLTFGFVQSGVPMGITLTFLCCAPLVGEVSVLLLWQSDSFGPGVAVSYALAGMLLSIVAGILLSALPLDDWLNDWVKVVAHGDAAPATQAVDVECGCSKPTLTATGSSAHPAEACCVKPALAATGAAAPADGASCGCVKPTLSATGQTSSGPADVPVSPAVTKTDRLRFAIAETQDVVYKVYLYVFAGIAIGAGIHGWAPTDLFAYVLGADQWWSVFLAILVGVPLYANAAGAFPVMEALLSHGASLGTVLALMMSIVGLSLPEGVLLRRVFSFRLLAVFYLTIFTGMVIIGYLFNAIY
jgi:uncharacterized membrane protein YraQ (UPF0718 family)